MITRAHEILEGHYAAIEARYKVVESARYGTLVTANGNSVAPIHRWFHMKEAYSNMLLENILSDSGLRDIDSLNLLDPFSGSGTTGVATGDMVRAGRLKRASITAIEVNPFLHLVSAAKIAAHGSTEKGVLTAAGRIARRAMAATDGRTPLPLLSTFTNPAYFPPENLMALRALRASLEREIQGGVDDDLRLFLTLALAATVEPSSNLRRDGRALRLSPGKASVSPIDVFLGVAERMADDLTPCPLDFDAEVLHADSRTLPIVEQPIHDLSLFSPPYPNNIDYTEVYKLEGWFLGLYGDGADFSDQRRQTIRSHSSLRWGHEYAYEQQSCRQEVEGLLGPILDAVPADHYARGRREVVSGYTDDMLSALRLVHSSLRPGGVMCVVVGNSMHGKSGEDYVIASDLLIARLAEIVGFGVEGITVARYPKRRTGRSDYLRESIVTAKKAG